MYRSLYNFYFHGFNFSNFKGWREKDRIVIAPTKPHSNGEAEQFLISGFGPNNLIKLLSKDGLSVGVLLQAYKTEAKYTGKGMSALMQAEVINLSRNVLITGDDFENVPCTQDVPGAGKPPDSIQADHCSCWGEKKRTRCTVGLHTVSIDEGSSLSIQYSRIEKCGQRGVLGNFY